MSALRSVLIAVIVIISIGVISALVFFSQQSQTTPAVDCVYTSSAWSTCDCPTFTQTRTNTITTQQSGTGKACPPTKETRACDPRPADCPKVDCVYTSTPWGTCSKDCGGGTQSRINTITTLSSGGGTICPPVTQSQSCNTQSCPTIDCQYTWSDWSACSKDCGGGIQERRPIITVQPANGGTSCPSPITQVCNTQPCQQRLVNLSDPAQGVIDTQSLRAITSANCSANTTRPECLWQYMAASSAAPNIRYLQSGNGLKLSSSQYDVLTVNACQPWDYLGCQITLQPDKRLISAQSPQYGISRRAIDNALIVDPTCTSGTQQPSCLWEFRS